MLPLRPIARTPVHGAQRTAIDLLISDRYSPNSKGSWSLSKFSGTGPHNTRKHLSYMKRNGLLRTRVPVRVIVRHVQQVLEELRGQVWH